MPQWNEQQFKAIHTKNKNILVSASAGAGKTTVLIARLVELVIKERIPITRILAMTFTEAAANEMKKRLAFELHALHQTSDDDTERQYISEQLSALANAHISTIHSFCLSIIQEYYYMIGISAKMASRIMSEADAQSAAQEAMDRVFYHQYMHNEEAFYQLTTMYSARGAEDDKLKSAIMSIVTIANAQSDPNKWLDECLARYQNISSLEQLPLEIREQFFAYFSIRCEQHHEGCKELCRKYEQYDPETAKKADLLIKKCAAWDEIRNAIEDQDYSRLRERFIAQCHLVPPTAPDKEDKQYTQLRKKVLAWEDALLANFYEERTLLKDLHDLEAPLSKLIEMSRDYRQAFAQIKAEQECIDFDDMEHFALQILTANNYQAANHYRNLFDAIMVDEFQDSNDVQNQLVSLICRRHNVFRVGDIKQSIYGFRHAKPQFMRDLIEYATADDEIIYLSNNYRSKQMIVDFNNQLFQELMNLSGFTGRYRQEDNVETGIDSQRKHNVPILFHALDLEAIREDSDQLIAANDAKASYIASQIVKIKNSQNRQWKDFAVLVRANARKQECKRIFDEWNIPCFINMNTGFYQSEAVVIILSSLNALMDPGDEIHFVAAITSPLFEVTMQELAEMRLQKGSDSYYDHMRKQHHPVSECFEQLRRQIHRMRPSEALNQLFAQNHFYDEYTDNQERTNLDLLFEQAVTFEQEEGKGLTGFLRHIQQMKEQESGEAMPIGSEDDVVRVMSIHQSKGLQFPIVFLWSTSRQNAVEFHELTLCDSDLGIALSHMDLKKRFIRKSVHRFAMEQKKETEELEEEMRILYVATTRAQEQLHIVDAIPDTSAYESPLCTSLIYERGGYSSWILHSQVAHENHLLFQIKTVKRIWECEIQTDAQAPYHTIPLYEHDDPIWQITTPSTTKGTPVFSLKAQSAMRYGTRMHKYIEELPSRLWTQADFEALSPKPTAYEITALKHLNENEVYRQANTYPKVYHELPFMVQDQHQILHGYIDFAAIGEDVIIIDFKTDAIEKEVALVSMYQDQLLAYEKAIKQLYPDKAVRTYLYSLYLHKAIIVAKQEMTRSNIHA